MKKKIRFLGTYIENNLSNKIKLNEVLNKIQNGVRTLNAIKNKFSYQAKIMIYYALIHSHLNYCPLIWLKNQPISKINILKKLQNKAVRSIFCAKYTCHTDPLYKLSGIVKVNNICKVELLFTMYQYKYGNLPKPLLELIQNSLIPKNEQTRTAELRIHGKHKQGTLLFDLIKTWNECDDVYIKK